jgi:predicted phosphoribosyltransferase
LSKISKFLSSVKDAPFLRFKDREKAASTLGALLKDAVKGIEPNDICVIGIPRGGVITADVIAKKIKCSLHNKVTTLF